MFATSLDLYPAAAKWFNDNQGVVSAAIFLATLALGWASGIFSALRRKPKFKLSLNDGPTFCCTYSIGKVHDGFEVHRTAVALYLVVANVGSAPSSIQSVSLAYHWHLRPFSLRWLRFRVGWFWLENQAVSLTDFHTSIGGNTKVYPFLNQVNFMSPVGTTTYLEVGRSSNGVVYFEQSDSWGGCFPSVRRGRVRVKVGVRDVFGKLHTAKFSVPSVSLEGARKYNPSFGNTLAELRGEPSPN